MATLSVDLDPFVEIVDFNFSIAIWYVRIVRDDGLIYQPESAESITIRLSSVGDIGLFSGLSTPSGGSPTAPLPFEEAVPGLVKAFVYQNGHYVISFNPTVLKALLSLATLEGFSCFLVTEGNGTLTTEFPRKYMGERGTALPAGQWEVTVPFWLVSHTEHYPDLRTVEKQSTLYASIPYQVDYQIRDGNALGWFLLPTLGVVWVPNAQLSGWIGWGTVDNICALGDSTIPRQSADITPPEMSPTDPEQRVFILHTDATLMIALAPCPYDRLGSAWPGTAMTVESNFGYQVTIPFHGTLEPLFQADYALGAQAANPQGRLFSRRYQFQWDRSSFLYDTGEGEQLMLGETATLIQSPPTDFEALLLQPLAE